MFATSGLNSLEKSQISKDHAAIMKSSLEKALWARSHLVVPSWPLKAKSHSPCYTARCNGLRCPWYKGQYVCEHTQMLQNTRGEIASSGSSPLLYLLSACHRRPGQRRLWTPRWNLRSGSRVQASVLGTPSRTSPQPVSSAAGRCCAQHSSQSSAAPQSF